MNFLQGLENTFGSKINEGLSVQTTLKGKTLNKAKALVLASLLAGLIRKVSTERGTDYLYGLLEDYDDSIIENFGAANDESYSRWKTDGEQLMPVLLISSIVKENIINHISRVIKENYQSTKKIFALLIPVLLSYVSKQLKEKNYSKKELVKALRAQKYSVKMQADEDISRELGMNTWHLNKTEHDEVEVPEPQIIEEIEEEEIIMNQSPPDKVKTKSGMPVWLWPLMLFGVLAMLIAGLQLGFDNESQAVTTTKVEPSKKPLADNSIKKKPVKPKKEDVEKNYSKEYFNKDYFAGSQKNNLENTKNETAAGTDLKKEEPPVKEEEPAKMKEEPPVIEEEEIVPEKIEKKGIEAEPVELKENTTKPVPPKAEPKVEEVKEPAQQVEEKTAPVEEKAEIKEIEPEKPKKKNYKGPLALLDMVANRTTASVLDFGNITDNSNQLTAKGKNMLNDVADIMKANPKLNITIRGHHKKHTNPNDNYNATIGAETKANATLNYLLAKGIDASRVKATSVGFNEPVNARDPGNDKNDRISIKTK